MTAPGDPIVDDGAVRAGMIVGGKFALIAQIGEGATGAVFEAEDTWLGRRVALKLLHAHVAANPDTVKLLRREARAAARINHPNIVAVHEVGERRDGSFYLVQELLQGTSLRQQLTYRGRYKPMAAIDIVVPIMGALIAVHAVGIIHRDLKPDNIFLARSASGDQIPKLIDFGIAKVMSSAPGASMPWDSMTPTAKDQLWGTPCYMAPEQIQGITINEQTDVWAMGTVLFELISGLCPFDAPTVAAVFAKVLTEEAPRLDAVVPGVASELSSIVVRALSRRVEQRYGTVRAFLDDLLDFASHHDATLRSRHARSIPEASDVESVDIVVVVDEEKPRTSVADIDVSVRPDMDWNEPPVKGASELERRIEAAEQALRVNALTEAVEEAEYAISTFGAKGEDLGRMRLVQAIAHRWLGSHADSERCAIEATHVLAKGATGWYAAVGHLAMAYGYQGHHERLLALAQEIEAHDVSANPACAISFCRCIVMLMRAGAIAAADRMFAQVCSTVGDGRDAEPVVHAWFHVAAMEFAFLRGDPFEILGRSQSAATSFAEAGDVRNACLQRTNVGNAYIQLGAHAQGAQILQDTILVIEPMKLAFVAAAYANLGLALTRLGDLDAATVALTTSIRECARQGYPRFEAVGRIYLAGALRKRGDGAGAEEQVRAAIALVSTHAPLHAYAQAVLADLLLARQDVAQAASLAKEAMETLETLDGVEEGETLIRLVFVMVLDAMNRQRSADAHLAGARYRVLRRAQQIADVDLRRSFLEDIPENLRTLELARRLDR